MPGVGGGSQQGVDKLSDHPKEILQLSNILRRRGASYFVLSKATYASKAQEWSSLGLGVCLSKARLIMLFFFEIGSH